MPGDWTTTGFEVEVGAAAAGGACVGRAPDGRVVFVRHSLPGELVLAVVTAETRSFLRADAVQVLRAAAERVEPPCPSAGPGRCGGCDWQHVGLGAQRRLKAGLVGEQLLRLAGISPEVVVEPVPGDEEGLGWRTRVGFAVDSAGRAGLRRHRSHEVEHVERCLLAAPGVAAVGAPRLSWPGAASVDVLTTADGTQRVVSVTGRRRGSATVPEGPEGVGEGVGVVVDGRPRRVPHGLRHRVGARSFEVSAAGFWQVHPGAAKVLAEAVLEGLSPCPGERAVDLYAGAGLFAALLGEAVGPSGSVLAVEGDARSAADAARNTADLPQVRVRTGAVDAALVRTAIGSPDLVVLDPPRSGAGLEVAAALAGLTGVRRLAYVACDAASLARDLRVFLDAGWVLATLRAFDLFPMTEHCELVAVLGPGGQDPSSQSRVRV